MLLYEWRHHSDVHENEQLLCDVTFPSKQGETFPVLRQHYVTAMAAS